MSLGKSYNEMGEEQEMSTSNRKRLSPIVGGDLALGRTWSLQLIWTFNRHGSSPFSLSLTLLCYYANESLEKISNECRGQEISGKMIKTKCKL